MKFVALVSGGKDSCHTICKSVFQYGHELVCIANLAPPDDFDGEEMNSFMFQTAASNTIAKLAQCFGVPLVRLPIKGSAVTQSLDYTAEVSGDEVEDLFFLLSEVKSQFPEVVAVSCGAILSTYQRLRVENVCSRLNLMVISYLWQRNRHSLLQEMLDDQLEAVLVKVAGAGLDPYKHLGRSLNALWGTLQHLSQRFGLDACGEGGEYETLTLSCRFFALTGRRLQLDETEVLIDDENCEVGNLKVVSCSVVPSSETAVASVPSAAAAASAANKLIVHELVEILQLICTDSCDRLTSLAQFSSSIATVSGEHKLEDYASFCNRTAVCLRHQQEQFRTWSSSRGDDYPISIPTIKIGLDGFGHTSLVYPPPALQLQAAEAADPALAAPRQLAGIMRSLEAALHRCGVSCADILYIHLYIASNELFAAVNAEYSKHFGVYPPSRSCVTVPLPGEVLVALDAVFLRGSHASMLNSGGGTNSNRQVLHVRSLSEWAPLCIGPYAQANTLFGHILFIAGQIPLNAGTMQLLDADGDLPVPAAWSHAIGGFVSSIAEDVVRAAAQDYLQQLLVQLALCLRHVHRVLLCMGSKYIDTLCCTVYLNISHASFARCSRKAVAAAGTAAPDATIVEHALRALACEMFPLLQYLTQLFVHQIISAGDAKYGDKRCDESKEGPTDDESPTFEVQPQLLPVLVVAVSDLPKDCAIEAEVLGFKSNVIRAAGAAAEESSMVRKAHQHLNIPTLQPEVAAVNDRGLLAMGTLKDTLPFFADRCPAPNDIAWQHPQHTVNSYTSSCQSTSLASCLRVGFVSVSSRNSEYERTVDLQSLCSALAHGIISCCGTTREPIHPYHLQALRVYFEPSVISAQSQSLETELTKQLFLAQCMHRSGTHQQQQQQCSPAIICIPVESLGYSSDGAHLDPPSQSLRRILLSCHFQAIDLAQLETLIWINTK